MGQPVQQELRLGVITRQGWSRWGLVLLLLITLSACTNKVAYNFLDWAIEWKVQRLVKLHGEQKILTQNAIKDFHHWHRTTQLPQYADYLRQLQTTLKSGPVSAQAIHGETDKVQILVDQSVDKVLPDAVAVLSMLSDDQVQELLKSVGEERDEYKDEYVEISEPKRQKTYYKRFLKRAQEWLGPLTREQKEKVKTWSRTLEPFEQLNLQQQKIWEETLAKTLAQRNDKIALRDGLQNLMFHRTDNWQPELEKILDRNQELTYQTIADLLNNLTQEQTAHLHKKIETYIMLFGELAGETKVSER